MEDIITDLKARGMLESFSDEAKVRELLQTKQTIYCGFDPSNSSMQLGNFIMIRILDRLQKAGHRIIAMVGGATGMIGDPSGKTAERNFLAADAVQENAGHLADQLHKYLDFSSADKGILVNNYDWWIKTNVIEYLRDIGKQIPINYMLAKEVVKSRLEGGISYAEFSYMLLQAGDFYRMYREYACRLQIGGGDQWGNLTTALDLVKRKVGSECPCQVFAMKLITDANGKKFGKSEKGALFLDPKKTPPFDIYQYFINVADVDVLKYLYVFDPRPLTELDKINAAHMKDPAQRLGQKELAYAVTALVHSPKVAQGCVAMTKALFDNSFADLNEPETLSLAQSLGAKEVTTDIDILTALVLTGLAQSKREAREFVKAGAVYVNGIKIVDETKMLGHDDTLFGRILFFKRGKKANAALLLA